LDGRQSALNLPSKIAVQPLSPSLMNARDVPTVIVDTSVETLHFPKTTINHMPRPATHAAFPAAIALALFGAVVIAASVIPRRDLDGRLGFVLFLLTVVGPVFIATGMAATVW